LRWLSEATGVPVQELFDAQDRNHAAQLARQKAEALRTQRSAQRQETAEAMRPDLGSGAAPTGDERSRAMRKALEKRDSTSFYEAYLTKK
jgi:hypothetical protein